MTVREPAVSRKTLRLTGGLLWLAVGLFLCARAVGWLPVTNIGFLLALGGTVGGVVKGLIIFGPLARKNIARIQALSPHKEKICVFAFQALSSYLIALAMIALGLLLRVSPLPKSALAVIYLFVGVGLMFGSWHYLYYRPSTETN